MQKIQVPTTRRTEMIDITGQVRQFLQNTRAGSGIVVVSSPHTTAGITVNENADPDVPNDITTHLNRMVPKNHGFRHAEGNADAHIKGTLVNFSQTFIVENGKLQLGTWQGVFFMEFDGPREREVWLKFIAETPGP